MVLRVAAGLGSGKTVNGVGALRDACSNEDRSPAGDPI